MNKEYDIDDKYCYKGTNVLKNKLNITDATILYNAERDITSVNLAKVRSMPVKGVLDFEHLRKIHYHIFKDIYNWAGQIRSVNISKGNMFCLYENIDSYGSYLFEKLRKENYLTNIDKNFVCDRLSFFMSEINALHPFREGNGRSQRVFMSYLAKVAGYELSFDKVTRDEIIQTSNAAFINGHEEYINMFEKITSPISYEEQKEFILSIGMESVIRDNKKTIGSMKKEIECYRSNSIKNNKINSRKLNKDLER